MKRLTVKKSFACIMVLVLMIGFGGCGNKKADDPVNNSIQAKLDSYFLENPLELNKFSCTLTTNVLDKDGNTVENSDAEYTVTTDRKNELIKIELEKLMTYDLNESGSIDYDTAVDDIYYKDWYIRLDGNIVELYMPNEDKPDTYAGFYLDYTYSIQSYDNADLAGSIRSLFFPADLKAVQGSFVSSEEDTWGYGMYKGDKTVRTISSEPFAKLIEQISGDKAPNAQDLTLTVYTYDVPEDDQRYSPSISFFVDGAENLIAFAAKALFGDTSAEEYANKGYSYKQTIMINFKDDHDYDHFDPITLPNV